MDIIKTLESYDIHYVNEHLEKLFGSDDLDERMEYCDGIIQELESNGIDVDDDMEDEIKSLAI